MQKEGIHVNEGGVGCRGRPEGPLETFVDLGSPHDYGNDGPRDGGCRRRGKEPMAKESRGRGNDRGKDNEPARDIGMRYSIPIVTFL